MSNQKITNYFIYNFNIVSKLLCQYDSVMSDNVKNDKDNFDKEVDWLIREKYGGLRTGRTEKDITRLKSGEPVDYVIGFVEFLGCKIDLSLRPLIPRPETECWVEKMITEMKSEKLENPKCLDIFSGSGCVGISILKHIPTSSFDFVDLEEQSLNQIKLNCKQNNIDPERYNIIKSDMFSSIADKYDYIFANPPYIAKNKKNEIQKSVLNYEPHTALFGGDDGLLYIKKFLTQVSAHLNKNGKIYMEFGSDQKDSVAKILSDKNFAKTEFRKDQFGKWRFVVVKV